MIDLKDIKFDFRYAKKRGAVNSFILQNGGYQGIIDKYGSVTAFVKAMQSAGFSKSWAYSIKKKFKKQGF